MNQSYNQATDADESVYNLIPRAQELTQRPPIHKSRFPGKIDPHEFDFGGRRSNPHATFGRPNGDNAIPPTAILFKHSKEQVLPDPAAPTTLKLKSKAAVPKKEDKPVFGLSSNKNFITANAVEDYGQVPTYLKRNKSLMATEKQQFAEYMQLREGPLVKAHRCGLHPDLAPVNPEPDSDTNPDPIRAPTPGPDAQSESSRVSQLAESDRHELLRHLKQKWGSINGAYQKLSLSVDSVVKRHHKEEMERQLGEVEKDIKTLERGGGCAGGGRMMGRGLCWHLSEAGVGSVSAVQPITRLSQGPEQHV
ncbi:MAG: hypothetical protein WDW38_003656 [Sanguina aurantia]